MELLTELNRLPRAQLADTPLRSLKNSLIASITFFTRAAIAGGVPNDEAFTLSDSFIQSVERQNDMRVLHGMERDMVSLFIDRVEENRTRRASQLVRRVIGYVDEHLAEDLSTPIITQAVFVHPDHLSRRFRQETGETLHSYILRRRVEEAAHFMRYSHDSINDIASLYQFSSQSHFCTVFKKYIGVTPQRYRNEELADSDA